MPFATPVRRTAALLIAVALAAASVSLRAQDAATPPGQAPPQSPATPPAGPPDVYTIGRDRVAAPRLVSEVSPNYTAEAMRARI